MSKKTTDTANKTADPKETAEMLCTALKDVYDEKDAIEEKRKELVTRLTAHYNAYPSIIPSDAKYYEHDDVRITKKSEIKPQIVDKSLWDEAKFAKQHPTLFKIAFDSTAIKKAFEKEPLKKALEELGIGLITTDGIDIGKKK